MSDSSFNQYKILRAGMLYQVADTYDKARHQAVDAANLHPNIVISIYKLVETVEAVTRTKTDLITMTAKEIQLSKMA